MLSVVKKETDALNVFNVLLVPYRWNRGTIGFLAVCQSVCPSLCLSVRPLNVSPLGFPVFSQSSFDIDLKYGIWIRLVIIQIKCDSFYVRPTFTWVIALCKNSVARTFLSRLLLYWLAIWYMNLSWHNTDQVWLLLRMTNIYMNYSPLLKFCFPDFSLSSFEILTWNFMYEFV